MKRYFVITHHSENNSHLNEQDLLPASCNLITGLAVVATAKSDTKMIFKDKSLSYPQELITNLLNTDRIANLFYSFLRTRSSEDKSRSFFESDLLPEIAEVLTKGIVYDCLEDEEQQELSENMRNMLYKQFTTHLYDEASLYTVAKDMSNLEFADFIAQQTLIFTYSNKEELFKRTIKAYEQPKSYECGNISLLINGNSFLLRDYTLTANRKINHMSKEIISFYEPLEVNSNLHTVFKSNKNSAEDQLTIRIYVEYEHK